MVSIFEVEKCFIPYFAGKISGFIINSDSFINQKAKDQKMKSMKGLGIGGNLHSESESLILIFFQN